MAGRRDGWADQSNPHSSRVVGGTFGQKGCFGPQRPTRGSGPLHNPGGDPFTLRLLLKGKKGFGSNLGPSPNDPVMKGLLTVLKEGGPQTNPFETLRGQIEDSTLEEHDVVVEGRATVDFEKEGEEVAVSESSHHLVDSDLLNMFEISTPTVVNFSSLSVFDRPLFQGGSSSLGGLHVLGDKEGVLLLAIVAEKEVEGGTGQVGLMVGFEQEEEIVEATPLAVEGYESWEDSMLVKFSEFLGFSTVGFEP